MSVCVTSTLVSVSVVSCPSRKCLCGSCLVRGCFCGLLPGEWMPLTTRLVCISPGSTMHVAHVKTSAVFARPAWRLLSVISWRTSGRGEARRGEAGRGNNIEKSANHFV